MLQNLKYYKESRAMQEAVERNLQAWTVLHYLRNRGIFTHERY